MLHVARAIVEVLCDLLNLAALFLRSTSAIRAENLALRKQLAAYIERGGRPQRLDHAGRVSLSVLSRLFSWCDAVVIARPSTVIRWHRLGWRSSGSADSLRKSRPAGRSFSCNRSAILL
jgi:putative transposase